jgi:GH25 family lysozyme M1 (1,4-beta-N-acetylmuramidase)
MKCSTIIFASILGLTSASPSNIDKRSQPEGLDVSGWQGRVNWNSVKANGASFAIVKVTSFLLLLDHSH